MAFTHKKLSVTFDYEGKASKTIGDRRISARINTPGGMDKGNAVVNIFGMSLSDMNALAVLPTQMNTIGNNKITVHAGEEGGSMSVCFQGTVDSAFVQGQSMPEVSFIVSAHAALYEEMKPAKPFSSSQPIDVAQTMQQFANDMGFTFENNGISKKLDSRYFFGSTMQQVRNLAREAGIEHVVEKNVLAIWEAGKTRQGDDITISAETGLVGLPSFSASGLSVTTIYLPTLNFGSKIKVQSILTPACGEWGVHMIDHALDAEVPHGSWFTTLQCNKLLAQTPS